MSSLDLEISQLDPPVRRPFEQIIKQTPWDSQHLADDSVGTDEIAVLPQCLVFNASNFPVATTTVTTVNFDGEQYDLGTSTPQHDNATNNSRIVCRQAGLYQPIALVRWPSAGGTLRYTDILVNGTTGIGFDRRKVPGVTLDELTIPTLPFRFAVGDYIELRIYQDSGGTVTPTPSFLWLGWTWISP